MLARNQMKLICGRWYEKKFIKKNSPKLVDQNHRERDVTFWVRETLGTRTPAEKLAMQLLPLPPGIHMLHLPIANDSRWSSESILIDENNGPPGVSGVAGTDAAVGVPDSDSGIFFLFFKKTKIKW